MTEHIVAIGPLPPPLHGLSLATSAMIDLLVEDNTVVVANLSPSPPTARPWRHPAKLARVLAACNTLFRQRRSPGKRGYIACDGGLGQIYTLLLVVTARLLSYPTYLHHHSFRYIDNEMLAMRLILTLAGPRLTHVFLGEAMRERFTDTYAKRIRSKIVSNAAFVAPQARPEVEAGPRPLTIGLLSNLNADKGLHIFLALLRQARREGLSVRAILAGPAADTGDRAAIDAAVTEFTGTLEYRGPVEGEAKARFYDDIDVFVFPTTYADEAQPIVLFEAKAAGNAIIAYDRGCIHGQLDETDLLVPQTGEFEATALAWLSLCDDPSRRSMVRQRIRRQYEIRHRDARKQAKSLIR
jgi:glycosyltransferase involved in cell wall biosynthesis